ncbi:RNA polymerase subunit sigma-70 [Actinosynnema sp. CS-041913]|uniref:RNA polymerase subunit sigma-70 n=1 Tax=Actinosynnema sp. CS-041913 TaxID=3239917 RepID=UPI003D9116DE
MDDFVELVHPYRGELLAHCARMLGSVHDAEDLVQETYLRAWRARDSFEGRSSLRTWLYRIATNACLNALDSRRRRPVPAGFAADDLQDELPHGVDPAEIVATREHRKQALSAVWRRLPPQQRAVLILRDVMSWQANEIAHLLGTSGSAVHSMVRRARAQLAAAPSQPDPDDRRLAEYAAAFETGDVSLLMRELTEETPAENGWESIVRLIAYCPLASEYRKVPIAVRGRPGFGVYRADAEGVYRPHTVDVLTVSGSGVERLEMMDDRSLFRTLGLPAVLG